MSDAASFHDLALDPRLLEALEALGYQSPTPIQAETIPYLLEGQDVIGQAQTGTGKTAAFGLPLLSQLDFKHRAPQMLVLAPTRELAIQVADAFVQFTTRIKGFKVAVLCGGQDYRNQLKQLKQGVQVVVGTPGRVMDHMRRGTLNLDDLSGLVLDEADEMLRMGFIDDIEWVLDQLPEDRQNAFFSATMPKPIRDIAKKHLNQPKEVKIKVKTETVDTIDQGYLITHPSDKDEILARLLEVEAPEAAIIFVRTKAATLEVTERLIKQGHRAIALNGDISQNIREKTIKSIKSGKVKLLVATDVAARGLDIDRISHVFNYDVPFDPETYVHRIGRTGRAGRTGKAILFISPRERSLLRTIERVTKHKVEEVTLPSARDLNEKRIEKFKESITLTLEKSDLDKFKGIIDEYLEDKDVSARDVAAALASRINGRTPFFAKELPKRVERMERGNRFNKGNKGQGRRSRQVTEKYQSNKHAQTQSYRIEVGHDHGAKPQQIVGAIANETGISGRKIGKIKISRNFSTVDLPNDISKKMLQQMKKIWVCGQQLNISVDKFN